MKMYRQSVKNSNSLSLGINGLIIYVGLDYVVKNEKVMMNQQH